MPNGDLVVGGDFTMAGGITANRVARWNGATWSAIGSGMTSGVYAMVVMPNGDLVVGGSFVVGGGATGAARWNGTAWTSLGLTSYLLAAFVDSLVLLPNGDLVAGGSFGYPLPGSIARFNGTTWGAFGGSADGTVLAMAMTGTDVAVGGEFMTFDYSPSAYFVRVSTDCQARAVPAGAGCSAANGPLTLAANALPYAGSTLSLSGSNLPVPSFVIAVSGLTPISPGLPLLGVFPTALQGCDLHVAPDLVDVLLALTPPGTATWVLPLPNTPAIAGLTLFHQMIAAEVDAQLHFLSVTSTNALQLTIGFF